MKKLAVVEKLTQVAGKTGLKVKKYSPEILFVAGTVGVCICVYKACKATLKLEETIDKKQEVIDTIKGNRESNDEDVYPMSEYRRDISKAYISTGVELAKLYGPSVVIGAVSISMLVGSHKILRDRNIALMAAYSALDTDYKNLFKRVKDKYGEEEAYNLRHGIVEEEVEIEDPETGEKKVEKRSCVNVEDVSKFARFFDASSKYWHKNPEYNLIFLRDAQNIANDKLYMRGHIFLNEVYDMLDIPRTKDGQKIGWILDRDGKGYVDFGIYDMDRERTRAFINGTEPCILLDFNVDGVIHDKI